MIASLRGVVLSKTPGRMLLEVQGVGYDISVPVGAFDRIPGPGGEAMIYISESMAMYGGGVSLYGFLSLEEKELYELLREIPGTGAKKAIEYLDKVLRSAPDFRRAVLESDSRSLVSLFGFTRKTADKIIAALKDRLADLRLAGREKWAPSTATAGLTEALAALVSLGYRDTEARAALERVPAPIRQGARTGELVKEALRQLS